MRVEVVIIIIKRIVVIDVVVSGMSIEIVYIVVELVVIVIVKTAFIFSTIAFVM